VPYLHCPQCRRTAWLSAAPKEPLPCRRCGTALDPLAAGDARFLASAVRELRARRAATSGRFTRDAGRRPGRSPR
jgi:ribosomal protein S27E